MFHHFQSVHSNSHRHLLLLSVYSNSHRHLLLLSLHRNSQRHLLLLSVHSNSHRHLLLLSVQSNSHSDVQSTSVRHGTPSRNRGSLRIYFIYKRGQSTEGWLSELATALRKNGVFHCSESTSYETTASSINE
jgi:hypothetical protein